MKKWLFGILSIIGIGFSFCNADTFRITDYFNNASCAKNTSYYSDNHFEFAVENSIILKSFCFSSNPSAYLLYSINSGDLVEISNYYQSGSEYCYDFGSGNGIKFLNTDSMVWYFLQVTGTPCFNCCGYRPVRINGNNIIGYSFIQGFKSLIIAYPNNNYPTYFGPVIYYESYNPAPTFIVNYGNTSKEYELTSDLNIYLKSPVIQNGNTFTYAGSTGLNLFFNGSSQWYDKSNLYLNSMYWFSNNIFTPICM